MFEFFAEHFEAIVALVMFGVTTVLALPKVAEWKVRVANWRDDNNMRTVYDLTLGIVAEVYQCYVRDLKATGKFNGQAKEKAVAMAMGMIKGTLKEKGIDIAMEILPALIEKAVSKMQSEAPTKVKVPAFSSGPEVI